MARPRGSFCLVLHTHLPFVIGHGAWPHGETWLHEAAAECYLPLLRVLDGLVADGISPRTTIGITPILAEMLDSDAFRAGFPAYLDDRERRAEEDADRFASEGNPTMSALAREWRDRFAASRTAFREVHGGDLVGAFRRLQDEGHIEILTSAATHGYLPLLGHDDHVAAQLRGGVAHYRRRFGRRPRGVWLPECAYRPRGFWERPGDPGHRVLRRGIEAFLGALGLRYFLVDTHLFEGGVPLAGYEPRFAGQSPPAASKVEGAGVSVHEAVRLRPRGRGVAVLARHPRLSMQVWSADLGYPGDGAYLEFHRKAAGSGLRYWRITDRSLPLEGKAVYEPGAAAERVREHARHFAHLVRQIFVEHRASTGQAGLAVAPFDTELFGHWWHEGPLWLDRVLRLLADSDDVEISTCSQALRRHPPTRTVALPEGSWGLGGHDWPWANPETMWTWDRVYRAEDRLRGLLRRARGRPRSAANRVLAQLGREVLLLEASDWPFLITTRSAREYAASRVELHAAAADRLATIAERLLGGGSLGPEDASFLAATEGRDFAFADLDLGWWSPSRR